MTLYKVIETLKMLAMKHPNVNSAYEGNIYDIMNASPEQKYASVVLTQQPHTQDETYDYYGFSLFYVDRLVDDMDENRVQIQSTAKNMLSNIIKAFCDEFDAECDRIEFHTFTEKFADECAGAYCTITINILKDITCSERYWDENWVSPLISVRNQNKSVEFTENGVYTIEYDAANYTGLGKVSVEVNVPDLNGSYDEGYSDGKIDGYAEGNADGYVTGKDDGIAEQKLKLETISITENGTYSREDGYNQIVVEVEDLNGSYDEGYSDGYAEGVEKGFSDADVIIGETAQVLNITENGSYSTKYTKHEDVGMTQVTGYFDDGTPFYEYAQLTDKVFKTDVKCNNNSRLEIWWKPDFNWNKSYYGDGIFSQLIGLYDFSLVIVTKNYLQEIKINMNGYERSIDFTVEDKWYHFLFTKEGLCIDGVKVIDVVGTYPLANYIYINYTRKYSSYASANGYYGMIKLDDNIYIPTENGFINYKTNEPLEVYNDGGYNFIGLRSEDNLIRTVNVNIVPKINVEKEGLRLGYSDFKEVPEWVDFEGITKTNNMFNYCEKLTDVPLFDTSKVTTMSYIFENCKSLTDVPLFDTSNVTSMNYMFNNCEKLTTIPQFDTSKCTNMSTMLGGCTNLETLPPLNCSSINSSNNYPLNSYSGNYEKLTDVGGFIDMKINWNNTYGLVKCPNLTYQSCINILNGLYDFTGNGEKPSSSQGQLKVHANFLSLVGDEISQLLNI